MKRPEPDGNFEPWFMAGAALLRCKRCGALVITNDTLLHLEWHEEARV